MPPDRHAFGPHTPTLPLPTPHTPLPTLPTPHTRRPHIPTPPRLSLSPPPGLADSRGEGGGQRSDNRSDNRKGRWRGDVSTDGLDETFAMRLSPDLFEKMTGRRPSPTEPSPRAVRQERRVDARIPFNGRAALLERRGAAAGSARRRVRDISPGGVALLHDVPLPPDSLFVVLLETRQHGLFPFRCRVMRCAGVSDTCHMIGAVQAGAARSRPRPAPAARRRRRRRRRPPAPGYPRPPQTRGRGGAPPPGRAVVAANGPADSGFGCRRTADGRMATRASPHKLVPADSKGCAAGHLTATPFAPPAGAACPARKSQCRLEACQESYAADPAPPSAEAPRAFPGWKWGSTHWVRLRPPSSSCCRSFSASGLRVIAPMPMRATCL